MIPRKLFSTFLWNHMIFVLLWKNNTRIRIRVHLKALDPYWHEIDADPQLCRPGMIDLGYCLWIFRNQICIWILPGNSTVLRIQNYYFGSGSEFYWEGHFGFRSRSRSRSCLAGHFGSGSGSLSVKFSHLKSECTLKRHFCAKIELFVLKMVFLSLYLSF